MEVPPPVLKAIQVNDADGNMETTPAVAQLVFDEAPPLGLGEEMQTNLIWTTAFGAIQIFPPTGSGFDNGWNITAAGGWQSDLYYELFPGFFWDYTTEAYCVTARTRVVLEDAVTFSEPTPPLCSIHLKIVEVQDSEPPAIQLVWNSPHALSDETGGGPFLVELGCGDDFVPIHTQPDGGGIQNILEYELPPEQCSFTFRVRRQSANSNDYHISNVATWAVENNFVAPVISHVDVVNGLAEVHWEVDAGADPNSLGYGYKISTGENAPLATVMNPLATSWQNPTSNAGTEPEGYKIQTAWCLGTSECPDTVWSGATAPVSSIHLNAVQIPCSNRGQLLWKLEDDETGGGQFVEVASAYYPQYSSDLSSWTTLDTLPPGSRFSLHLEAELNETTYYRVLAETADGDNFSSNVVPVLYSYPDTPEPPQISRASVYGKEEVRVYVKTDEFQSDSSEYELQRWDEYEETWQPLERVLMGTWNYPAPLPTISIHDTVFFDRTELNTDDRPYRYRIVGYNACDVPTTTSNEAQTIWLQGFQSVSEDTRENSLIWTGYEGFLEGVDRYKLTRRASANSPLEFTDNLGTFGQNARNAEDNVEELLETTGLFCYQITAFEESESSQEGATSNWVCLTEDPIVWIPSAFTPNGDDLNDWYPWDPDQPHAGFVGEPQGESPNFRMRIINRWGVTVFESETLDEPWDGRVHGKPVQHGVYVAVFQYLDGSGAWKGLTTSVAVLPGE